MSQNRNHPDHEPDDALLESARTILTTKTNTFVATPWRITMARAQAEANQKAMRAAQKKLGIKPPKETQDDRTGTPLAVSEEGQSDDVGTQLSESEMQVIHAGRRATDPIIGHLGTPRDRAIIQEFGDALNGGPKALLALDAKVRAEAAAGGCAESKPAVESGFSIFNQSAGAQAMTADTSKTPDSNRPELKASPAQLEKQEAAKKAIADKAAKKLAAETKKTEANAAREAKAKERAETIKSNAAAREAKAEELKASGKTYVGSMTQLAERVKAGAYVKSMTGQLRSSDDLAVALDAVPPVNVVLLGIKALKLEGNPYPHLNIGQQSMNLRNRMRGAIKKGTLTLDEVKNIRDNDGLATAEAEVAKKKEAAAERVKKAEDAKAAKLALDAKALEAKQLKEAEALKAKTAEQPKIDTTKPAPAAKKANGKAQAAA